METTAVITPESISLKPKDPKKDKKSDFRSKKGKKDGPDNKRGEGKPNEKGRKNKQQPTEEENEQRRKKYEELVRTFVASSEDKIEFPPDLNSFERRLIHQICEAEGLVHESQGEGEKRHIVVMKTKKEVEGDVKTGGEGGEDDVVKGSEEEHREEEEEEEDGEEEEGEEEDGEDQLSEEDKDVEEKEKEEETKTSKIEEKKKIEKIEKKEPAKTGAIPKTRTAFINGMYREIPVENPVKSGKDESPTLRCKCCGKDILRQNYSIHNAQCERKRRAKQEAAEKNKEIQKNAPKSNEVRAPKLSKKKNNGEEKEDFDAVIAQFTKENNTCSQPKCKTPTSVIFQLCPFCRKTYCLTHHMAEIHGCGDEARRHAREMVLKEGKLYPGSGIPSKKPNEMKRKQLKRNFDKKLNDLTNQRQKKKSDKDKDKGKNK